MSVPQRNNQFSCAGIILKNRQDACSTKKQSVFLCGYHSQEQARCLFHKETISFLVGRASCPSETGLYGQNLGSS
ncbi:hypothetical protein QUB28_23230 [Microcoleus sp. B4-C3]|uniref:hypothetical protein n=1 Tax=Microcoleus sp. B4-C2 TaxID=2818661 RepID=UPI002FD3536D